MSESSDFVPQDQTKAGFTVRLLVPLEERWVIERPAAPLGETKSLSATCSKHIITTEAEPTHRTNEALPTPLPA